jgi:phospholipid/cholesterol/gamma-HCH transport system permease protein
MVSANPAYTPVRALGEFFAMCLDTFVQMFRPPWAWREFLLQTWFVARVSIVPTLMLSIPFTVLTTFAFNALLLEIGAADFSGTGAAYASVTQVGPIVTDAMRVLGVNPIQALVLPRVLAAALVSLLLTSMVTIVGIVGSFVFSVFLQNVTPGPFVAGLTVLVGLPDVIVGFSKAAIFGLAAGLIACYKGISVGGGPQGVGNAVNETVVFTFVALFVIDIFATAIGVQVTK